MWCRGVRGATAASGNTKEEIVAATRNLLEKLVEANGIRREDVASVLFTTTTDLNAEFPALAARQMGWKEVALLCGHEMNVPGSLQRCVRILIHWNTERKAEEIVHLYLNEAASLRSAGNPRGQEEM